MKNTVFKDILIFFIMVGVIFIICLFLPEKVAIHYNAAGEADTIVNRFFLMFGAPIPFSLYWKLICNKRIKRKS